MLPRGIERYHVNPDNPQEVLPDNSSEAATARRAHQQDPDKYPMLGADGQLMLSSDTEALKAIVALSQM